MVPLKQYIQEKAPIYPVLSTNIPDVPKYPGVPIYPKVPIYSEVPIYPGVPIYPRVPIHPRVLTCLKCITRCSE